MDLKAINLLILDVDGVLTDGSIVMSESSSSENGILTKVFQVQDGCAIKRWRRVGHQAALISGRRSPVVARRAGELGIEAVEQGCDDKAAAYGRMLKGMRATDAAVCYVGDDLPDLAPMRRCAFPVAAANAVPSVKRVAQYVTRLPGGAGAVAEVIELILRKQQRWKWDEIC